ncbi:hypothetical protein ACFLRX_09665, partial [Acidobacteriota bacterium]
MKKILSIGRPVDLSYPTNRAIALLVLGVVVVTLFFKLFSHESFFRSGKWGLEVGFSVFLAWALCRELDPDNDFSAFLGAGVTLIGVYIWGLPSFLALFWILVILRILNRSGGLPAKVADSLVVLILGGVLVYQGNWGYGVLTALAFFLDARLPSPHRRQIGFVGLALMTTVTITVLKQDYWTGEALYWKAGAFALGLSVVFIPIMFKSRILSSTGDETGEPLIPLRVLSGQGLVLVTGIISA